MLLSCTQIINVSNKEKPSEESYTRDCREGTDASGNTNG
jgi:hypothetical protein